MTRQHSPETLAAMRRMFGIAATFPHGDKRTDPVGYANAQTSYHDARAALCLTLGCSLDEIDPVTGHDMRRSA